MASLLVQPFRFQFVCEDPVYFPAGKFTNILRGAFGVVFRRLVCHPACASPEACPVAHICPYARLFATRRHGPGPSGMADLPRPFVFRPSTIAEMRLAPGQSFNLDVHIFDLSQPCLRYFVMTLSKLVGEGIGPGRPRVRLDSVACLQPNCTVGAPAFDAEGIRSEAEQSAFALSLDPPARAVSRLRLDFMTPTEFKAEGAYVREPRFDILVCRARDRINALSTFYQNRRLELDFRGLAERARAVRLVRSSIVDVHLQRWSSLTGLRHEIGGFLGSAEYEGELSEFLPLLEAAYWTGVGRQSVWGNGAMGARVLACASSK